MRRICLILCLVLSPAVAAAPALTVSQLRVLNMAIYIGEQHGEGLLLAAIVWQESSLCVRNHQRKSTAMGCGQDLLKTARDTEELPISAWMLAHDWALNLEVSADYLRLCESKHGYAGGIYAYYWGLYASQPAAAAVAADPYVKAVLERVREIESLPVSTD